MFLLFISCVSLVVLSIKRSDILPVSAFGDLTNILKLWGMKIRVVVSYFQAPLWDMMYCTDSRCKIAQKNDGSCLLDLPELPLHCILDRLSPDELFSMAAVCKSLRVECVSNFYWKKHLKAKWGRIFGKSAYEEWHCYVLACKRSINLSRQVKGSDWFISIFNFLPNFRKTGVRKSCVPCNEMQPKESAMALYLALESGKFWFPAQVYNRENGHAGFLLSCYDAKVRYEPATNTFNARYSPHGRQTLEENIEWERIRAPAVDTPSNTIHISDCLSSLQPGDHVEIQWRRNKEFPYGWWYGVVGHMETCNGDESHCGCHQCDTVVLEFKQYAQGSRWRKKMVKRDSHIEEGDAIDGFYGGIRNLSNDEEISTWKSLWPSNTLH